MGNYKLQMYTPDLWQEICRIHRCLGGRVAVVPPVFLDWKYLRNPFLDQPLIYLALYGRRVVGMRAVFGTCWEAGDCSQKVVLPVFSDTGIVSEHRDRGLYAELSGYAMDDLRARGFSHVLSFTPNASNYVVSVMTMGWRPLGSQESMTRGAPSSAVTAVQASHSGSRQKMKERIREVSIIAGRQLKAALRINAFAELEKNVRAGKSFLSVSRTPRPLAMAKLVSQIGGDARLRHVRDRAYFSWRFDNPRFCYRFIFWGRAELDGYMILQNTPGRRQVNIIDWEGRNEQVRTDLLEAVIRLGRFRAMSTWGATLSDSRIETLRNNGFSSTGASCGHAERFMIRPLVPDARENCILGCNPLEQKNWSLRMMYSDGA